MFFGSGAAALVFETLWFHQAALAFGSGVWSAAVTLAAFMAGLALGNVWASRSAARVLRPLRFDAALELAVALGGSIVVVALPALGALLAPMMGGLAGSETALGLVRFTAVFVAILVPTTAMGATLPVLVRALVRANPDFASVLGSLYGWNTLGAVTGLLAAELLLIEAIGVRGSAVVAAVIDLAIAAAALRMREPSETPAPTPRSPKVPLRWLVAAALGGASMLALEVVWFRLLRLVHGGTTLVFALLVSLVLVGIGLGGLLAGRMSRRFPRAHEHVASVAFLAGIAVVIGFRSHWPIYLGVDAIERHDLPRLLVCGATLMLPVAVLSGVLFTWLGKAVDERLGVPARSAGLLTLANTMGAAIGSLVAGFVLLPLAGIEAAIAIAAAAYGCIGLLSLRGRSWIAGAALWAVALASFPRGHLADTYFAAIAKRYGGEIVAVREGPIQTAFVVRRDRFGQPFSLRLATDHHSMSSTDPQSLRYMKLFVWLPLALGPAPRRALLISYGVGNTAAALVATKTLEHIDVVDISADILALSPILQSVADPLEDERVAAHVEDGRFFLQTTGETYDLITGEPPPPREASVVNLYTREYFGLVRARLSTGGMVSYWLPAHALSDDDTRAIMGAFCGVFEDCSLWSGAGLDWILIGTNGDAVAREADPFDDAAMRTEMAARGIEDPAQLVALFLAGPDDLRRWAASPVTDDFPRRIGNEPIWVHTFSKLYAEVMDPVRVRERFASSELLARWVPAAERRAAERFLATNAAITAAFLPVYRTVDRWTELDTILGETELTTAPLWILRSDPIEQRLATSASSDDPEVRLARAIGMVARRDPGALDGLTALTDDATVGATTTVLAVFVACRAGDAGVVQRLRETATKVDAKLVTFLDRRCGDAVIR
jgi:spermidine synthase